MKHKIHAEIEEAQAHAQTIAHLEGELSEHTSTLGEFERAHHADVAAKIAAREDGPSEPKHLSAHRKKVEHFKVSLPVLKQQQADRLRALIPGIEAHVQLKMKEARELNKRTLDAGIALLFEAVIMLARAIGPVPALRMIDFGNDWQSKDRIERALKKEMEGFTESGPTDLAPKYHRVNQQIKQAHDLRQMLELKKIDDKLDAQLDAEKRAVTDAA